MEIAALREATNSGGRPRQPALTLRLLRVLFVQVPLPQGFWLLPKQQFKLLPR